MLHCFGRHANDADAVYTDPDPAQLIVPCTVTSSAAAYPGLHITAQLGVVTAVKPLKLPALFLMHPEMLPSLPSASRLGGKSIAGHAISTQLIDVEGKASSAASPAHNRVEGLPTFW